MGDESAFKLVTRKNNRHKKSAKRQRPSSNIHVKESDQLFSSEDKRKIILNVEHARLELLGSDFWIAFKESLRKSSQILCTQAQSKVHETIRNKTAIDQLSPKAKNETHEIVNDGSDQIQPDNAQDNTSGATYTHLSGDGVNKPVHPCAPCGVAGEMSDNRGTEERLVKKEEVQEETSESVFKEVVCYGLGCFSTCSIARHQMALLLLLLEHLQISHRKCYIYDPNFTKAEERVVSDMELTLIKENEEGKRHVDETTLFYMPHCGRPLYNNLLWTNWGRDQLCKVVIVGNSFSNMKESTITRKFQVESAYINKILPETVELPMVNNFRFSDIFNDTAIHIFPKAKLEQVTWDFWKERTEPVYGNDVEIIVKERQT